MKKFLILGDGIVSHLVANVLSNFGHKSFILKPKGTKKLIKSNRYFSLNILGLRMSAPTNSVLLPDKAKTEAKFIEQ